jgi:hypothetical protein
VVSCWPATSLITRSIRLSARLVQASATRIWPSKLRFTPELSFLPSYHVFNLLRSTVHLIYIEDAGSHSFLVNVLDVFIQAFGKNFSCRVNRKLVDVANSRKVGLDGLDYKKNGSEKKNCVYLGIILNSYQDANLRFFNVEGSLSLGLEP